jgi:hypothetical protein
MTGTLAARMAAAAESLVGTPFRIHGRDPATGLDCVGLVAQALARCDRVPVCPSGYRLRALDLGPFLGFAEANGLNAAAGAVAAGDVLLVHLHRIQPHLLLAVGSGDLVHAHAGLGRVVRQPGPCPWTIAARWRLAEKG